MNKRIENPLIVVFTKEGTPFQENGQRLYMAVNATNLKTEVAKRIADHDSVIIQIQKDVDLDKPGIVQNLDIKTKTINKVLKDNQMAKPVLSHYTENDTWYLLNPGYGDGKEYAPQDSEVLEKYHKYESNSAWQAHQAGVWSRVADAMPLSAKEAFGTPNQLAQLTAPNRGLEKEDLKEFWNFKTNQTLSPLLTGDDMVGMPGIKAKEYDGFVVVPSKEVDGKIPEPYPIQVLSVQTVGTSGVAIPMKNTEGNTSRYQVMSDPSKFNTILKARAKDGISVQKSSFTKDGEFNFPLADGSPSHLRVEKITPDGKVTLMDATKQPIETTMKTDIKPILDARGYRIPEIIDTLRLESNSKYIWQSKGTMIGSDSVSRIVAPTAAGFITAREPKNNADDYMVVVAEGALKGHIVAKYVNLVDKDGVSFADTIAGDKGIIVAQVPGVSRAYVESVQAIYEAKNVTSTLIAMDADGRENLAVARGIDSAYDFLSEQCEDTKVMSWDCKEKGLDDALLAVSRKELSIADMQLAFGTANELFPMDKAKSPAPYKEDGTRASQQEWRIEYAESNKKNEEKIRRIQDETKARAKEAKSAKEAEPVKQAEPTKEDVMKKELAALRETITKVQTTYQQNMSALQEQAEWAQKGVDTAVAIIKDSKPEEITKKLEEAKAAVSGSETQVTHFGEGFDAIQQSAKPYLEKIAAVDEDFNKSVTELNPDGGQQQ